MSIQSPKFIKRPSIRQATDVKKTVIIIIEATIQANPKPECVWTLNEKDIVPGEKISLGTEVVNAARDEYRCFLQIKHASVEDGGSYRLAATNSAGTLRAAVNINLQADPAQTSSGTKGSRPTFTEKPVIKQDAGGNKVIFECTLSADPKPECTWFKNDVRIDDGSPKYLLSMNPLPDNCYIVSCVMSDVGQLDAGTYSVVAKNAVGEASAKMSLKFDDDKGRPQIHKDISIRLFPTDTGSNIVIQCESVGDPPIDFVWSFEDKEIRASNKYNISTIATGGNKYLSSLTINNVTKQSDSGRYRLVAKNQSGEHSAIVKLDISTISRKMPIGFAPRLVQAANVERIGKDLKLVVNFTGSPPPVISWIKNGKPVIDDMHEATVEQNGTQYKSTLLIKNCKLADAGNFECKATNEFGTCIARLDLKLQGKEIVQSNTTSRGGFMKGTPAISYDQKSKKLSITCEFETTDDLTFDWFKSGSPLASNSKYRISQSASPGRQIAELEISNFLKDSDDGTYRLQTKWPSGQTDYQINVISEDAAPSQDEEEVKEDEKKEDKEVEEKPKESSPESKNVVPRGSLREEDKPRFLANFKPIVVSDGDKARLQCNYQSSKPVTVKWFFNGQPLPDTEEYDTSQTASSVSLSIGDCYPQDSGTYRCVLSNEAGSDERSAKVTVTARRGKMPRRKPLPKAKKQVKEKEEAAAVKPMDESDKAGLATRTTVSKAPEGSLLQDAPKRRLSKFGSPAEDITPTKPAEAKPQSPVTKLGSAKPADVDKPAAASKTGELEAQAPTLRTAPLKPSGGDRQPEASKVDEPTPQTLASRRASLKPVAVNKPGEATKTEGPATEEPTLRTAPLKPSGGDKQPEAAKVDEATPKTPASRRASLKPAAADRPAEVAATKAEEPTRVSPSTRSAPLKPSAGEKTGEVDKAGELKAETPVSRKSPARPVKVDKPSEEATSAAQQPAQKGLRKVLPGKVATKQDKFGQAAATPFGTGGQWPTLRKTTVAKKVPDHWVNHLVDKKANECDGTATMEATFCRAGGKLRWYKNRVEIFHGPKYKFITEGPVQMLQINKIIPDDSGRYICSVNDIETKAWLEVTPAKPEYDFYMQLPAKNTVFRTKPLFLECHVNSPDCPIKWFKGGRPIQSNDPKYKFYLDGTRCVLRINKVTRQDQDRFSCMIDDETGKTTECYLYVEEPQWRFSKKLPDKLAVDEKEDLELVVEVEDPDAECEWFFKGVEITEKDLQSGKYEMVVNGTVRKLIVKNADPLKDAGAFECHTGVMTTTCHVQVRPLLRISEDLKDVDTVEHEDVTLQVRLTKPKPMVTWMRDGKRILPSASNVILSDGETHSLTLKNVSLGDAGRYSVKVDNLESSAAISVREADKPAQIGDIPKSIAVSVGKPLHIRVPFKGFPKPNVKWFKDGKPVSLDVVESSGTESTLEIPITHAEDAGQYSVVVENSSGKQEAKIDVQVCDRPAPPEGPLRVGNITKTNCVLSWNAPDNDGGSPITGYVVEKLNMARGDWVECEHVPPNARSIPIHNLTQNERYSFRVKAKNQIGTSEPLETANPILAKDPFDPPSSPEDIIVKDVDSNYVTLAWKAPADTGGAPIEKFVIDKRETSGDWTKACEVDGDQLEATVKNLSEDKNYEFRVTAVNKAGPGKSAILSKPVKTEPKLVRPYITKGFLKDLTLKVGQTIKLSVPYRAKPKAECLWEINGQAAETDDRVKVKHEAGICELTITDAKRSDRGTYSIKLTNEAGSDAASANVVVLGPPGKFNKPLKVTDVTSKSAVLNWAAPDDDGGKPIQNYIIEKREAGEDWTQVGTTPSTQFKVPKLKEGQSYEFRVMAENAIGISEPIEVEAPVVAKNPYDIPGVTSTPIVVNRDRKHIELKWDPPMDDGGAPILGYIVERKEPESTVWRQVHLEDTIPDASFIDKKVTANAPYEYRVKAVNLAGPGKPSASTGTVLAKPEQEAPKIDQDKLPGIEGNKIIRINAGEPLEISMDFVGSPNNVVSWTKDNNSLPEQVGLSTEDENSKLRVPVSKRGDSGVYTMKVKNDLGEDTADVKVIVLAPPSQCTGPFEPYETTKDSVSLKWNPPDDDGGSMIEEYKIEKLPEGSKDWEYAGTCPPYDTKICVKDLKPMAKYNFRVVAKNKLGNSEPLETASVLVKPPYDPPSAPSSPEITSFDTDHISLEWDAPYNDGGNPISGYIVEMKDGRGEWTPCTSRLIDGTKFTATALKPNHSYEFRVKAVNEAGPGAASQPSKAQKAVSPINPPGAPEAPEIKDVNRNSAVVHWKPPVEDGGDKVTKFMVEMKTSNLDWTPVGETSGKERQLLIPNLREGNEVSFRVIAANSAGPGTPSSSSEIVTVKDPPAPPTLTELSKLRDITVRAGQPFSVSTSYSSSPLEVTVECTNGEDMVTNDENHVVKAENGVLTVAVKNCQRSDTGPYKVILRNSVGSGTAQFNVNVLDAPQKPEGPLEVSSVDHDRCTLEWKPPKDDGGSPVSSYIIEKRPVGSDKWTKTGPSTSGTTQTVRNLDNGVSYEFRVCAENENGRSEPLMATEPVRIKSPHKAPEQPGTPHCIDHTENSLTVAWEKPSSDGGEPITGYLLEYRESPSSTWLPYNKVPKPLKTATVGQLTNGKLYEFRVAAVNIAGQSPWSECDSAIEARPPDAAPFIPFTLHKAITVKAGEPIVVDVPFVASPIPQCSFMKNGVPVPKDDQHQITIEPNGVKLQIPAAKVDDAGSYTCQLKNDMGKAECNIHVNVIDRPSQPQGPLTVTDQTPYGCVLAWDAPQSDNGSPITNYVIEKCDVDTGRWEVVSKFCRDPKYEMFDLDENHSYLFRVSAENEAGVSEPLQLESPVKAQYPAAVSTAPRNLNGTFEGAARNVVLRWEPPLKDNGAKVQGYLLEYKPSGSDEWSELNVTPTRDTSFTVDHLLPSTPYQFRVCAVNAVGKSEFEQLDRPLRTLDLLKPPAAPHAPEALSVGSTFVQLVWEPPTSQEDAEKPEEITYKVEMKLPGSEQWIPTKGHPSTDNFTTINGLPENAEVEFRVRASNAAGESPWSQSSGKIKVTGYPNGVAPSFTRVLQEVVANPSSSARLEVEFEGSPMPDVRWLKNGVEIVPSVKHVMQGQDNRAVLILQDVWEVDDGTEYTCELSNPLGVEKSPCKLRVRSPPKFGNVQRDNDVVVGNPLRIALPLEGSADNRQIEIKKLGDDGYADASDLFNIREDEDGVVNLVLKDAKLADSGEYIVVASNGAGSASAHFGINAQDVPSTPEGPLTAHDTTKTSCKLSWKPPRSDGNSHITHYVLEKHDLARPADQWVTVDPCCKATNTTVDKLIPDHEYEFRVKAVNDLGESAPLYTESTIVAALPFGPPKCVGAPNVTEVGDSFVTLGWVKAVSDNDESPVSYHVEKRLKGQDQWQPVRTAGPLTTNSVEVPNLLEGEEYQFRIVAENEAGLGNPSVETDFVLIRDPYGIRAPQITRKLENVTVNEQSSARFEVELADTKNCEVTWFKGTDEIHSGAEYSMSKVGNVFSLVLNNPKQADNDETITFKVRNPEGVQSCRSNLTVLSKPKIKLPFRYNEVQEYTSKEKDITVRIPFTANPAPDASWFVNGQPLVEGDGVKITTSDHAATLHIENCSILGDYGKIELKLANPVGEAETSFDYKVTSNPGTPISVKADAVYDDCVTLVWQAPTSDGGSPIIDYDVEMLDPLSNEWMKAGACRSTRLVVSNLSPKTDYQFRVKAVNANGDSPASAPVTVVTEEGADDKLLGWARYGVRPDDGSIIRGIEGQEPEDYDKLYDDIWRTGTNPRPTTLNTGSIYDKYDVYEELGRSPFAVVHRAVNKTDGKNYAVKFIETPEPDDISLVEKEIDRMANLVDPNILNLRETFQNKDDTALVYELLTGDTLADQLRRSQRMTEPEAIAIVKQICQSVKTLHDNNMVHLDLKPESFIGSTKKSPQSIKLADFSLASKVIPGEEVKVSLASTEFAAPEVRNQEPVGFGTDMWAIGALAYAILTGDGPSDRKPGEAEHQKDFNIPSKFADDISDKGKDFIEKLLKRDKNARMDIHEALNHPWLNEIDDRSYPTLHPDYEGMRNRMSDKYKSYSPDSVIPESRLGIGWTSWYSSRIRREPKKYQLYKSSFDHRDYVPRIYIFKHDTYVLEGETAELSARVVSLGDVSVKWVKGSEVRLSNRISKRSHNKTYYIEIRKCSMEDEGAYTFVASNQYGDKTVNVNLHVQEVRTKEKPLPGPAYERRVREYSLIDIWQEPNKGPFFMHVLRARVLQSGQPVKLSCTVTGRPTPKISWFKGSVDITNDENYFTSNNHGVVTLEISRAAVSDTGSYRCHAENSMGSADTTCQLLVQGFASGKYSRHVERLAETHLESVDRRMTSSRTTYSRESVSTSRSEYMSTRSSITVEEDNFAVSQKKRQRIAYPPTIEEHIEPVTLFEGAVLQMRCVMSGRPRPDITWSRDGEVISVDNRIKQEYHNNVAQLTINPVSVYDSGEYKMAASNEAGSVSSSATVDVRSYGAARHSMTVKEEAKLLQVQSETADEPSTNGFEELVVDRAPIDDRLGQDFKSPEVVKEEPAMDETKSQLSSCMITKHLDSCILKTGQPLTMRCEIQGVETENELSAIWKRNDRIVPENPDFTKSLDARSAALTVTEMFPEDSGTFSVEIRKKDAELVGISACTVCVYDEDDPQVQDPLIKSFIRSATVEQGETAKFSANLKQQCEARWNFNGQPIEQSSKCEIREGTDEQGLSIPSVSKEDGGLYTLTIGCEGVEPITMSAYLNVL